MLDKNQLEIVNSNEPKIIVEAGAGSGKTKTLIERVKKLLLDGEKPENMVIITFTNMAAEELKERLTDVPGIGDCFVGTIHSFANKIFKNSNETYKLFTEEIQDQFMNVLINLYAKHLTMDQYLKYKDYNKKVELGILDESFLSNYFTSGERYEINVLLNSASNNDEHYKENIKTLCKKNNIITFDELLIKTTEYFKSINGKIEYLFVDEYQDIGPLEKKFFQALNADNYFYVGDEKQCQPAGTKILMRDGTEKNIEDIKIGDSLTVYLNKTRYNFTNSKIIKKEYKVLDIVKSKTDKLFEVITQSGKKSQYTYNHRCFAKMKNNTNDSWIVYIMCDKNNRYRVGKAKFRYTKEQTLGLKQRMVSEKCDKGWIVKVFDNSKDAWLFEQLTFLKYQIPQLVFQDKKVKYTQQDINIIYSQIGNLEERVKKCLEDNNKSIEFPFLNRNENRKIAKNHMFEIEACNLIPELMEMIEYDKNHKTRPNDNSITAKYVPIKEINIINKECEVYSLKVENENYVADGILTHNSLYGFKGGNVNFFLNLIKSPNWKTYYLNNNYRCGEKIIDIANEVIVQADDIINTTTICKSEKQGCVKVDSKYYLDSYLKKIDNFKDWFILVRTNKDLYKMEQKLQELELPYVSFKKGEISLEEMKQYMKEDKIKLLTIHASKGLESKNVLLWGNFPIHQKPYMRNSDERKVLYVGCTRAIDNLVILN